MYTQGGSQKHIGAGLLKAVPGFGSTCMCRTFSHVLIDCTKYRLSHISVYFICDVHV